MLKDRIVGETYFFRDSDAFNLLEHQILPQLISSRRGVHQTLRFWSAGCATGEEPYSIAIVVRRLLPDLSDWQVRILATDINPEFLTKAEQGVYGEWSFRGVDRFVKEAYFRKKGKRYEILPSIKEMVTFGQLNLYEASYPSVATQTTAMDVILCRNVLMYFPSTIVEFVTRKFHEALNDGGVLVVAPSEAFSVAHDYFEPAFLPTAAFLKKVHG